MKNIKNITIKSLTALTALTTLALASSALAQQKEIVIGAIYPLSGSLASTGLEMRQALEMAVDLINNANPNFKGIPLAASAGLPNLKGAKIKLVFADSQGKPEVGQAEAERLITQDKVVALIGAYQSAVTRTSSRVAEQYNIPYLNPESSSPDLTERGYKTFFRTTPNDETFVSSMFKFLNTIKTVPTKKIAVMHENTDFGVNTGKAAEKFATASGRTIVADISYTANSSAVTSEVQRLQAAGADVVIFASYTSDALLFVKTMKQVGYAPPIFMANDAGFIDNRFLQEVGSQVQGVFTREVWASDLGKGKPIIAQVDALFKSRTGKDLNGNSARSFQGMLTLADAINRAKSDQPDAILAALRATNLRATQVVMPWEGVKFDEKGQNTLGDGLILQLVGTDYRTVFPLKSASVKPTVPFTWK
jgi:branched-chain amino acid transport system substrate-binding protein